MEKVVSVCEDFLKPSRMEPVFCIPTYNRSGTIVRKTLRVLQEQRIPQNWIHLYVATEAEKDTYESSVPSNLYGHIHIAVPGLGPARNFILDSWPLGKWIVMMDDDVNDVLTIDASGALVKADLLKAVVYGFHVAKEVGCCLWGVYPVCNGFFMKRTITTDLRFCVGPCFGLINPGSGPDGIQLPATTDSKEDYVRTLTAYDRDGAVVRLNSITVKTNYYKEPGGLCTSDRLVKAEEAVQYILGRWPDRVARDTRKRKSGYPEIRIKKLKVDREHVRLAPDFTGH